MSDQKTGLPVRTEADGGGATGGRVHVKVVDFTTPAGANNQMQVSEQLAHIRAFGINPANAKTQLKLSELGNANGDGIYNVTNNTLPSTVGNVVHTRNATPGAAQQVIRQTGISNSTVHAADVAVCRGDGTPVSLTNPLHVTVVDSGGGVEVNDYNTDDAVAVDGTSNHDYTVTAANGFLLKRVLASASGRGKIEIQYDPDGVSGFTSVCVAFSSVANPNMAPEFAPLQLAQDAVVRVIRTNRDVEVLDLYSTIIGVEL